MNHFCQFCLAIVLLLDVNAIGPNDEASSRAATDKNSRLISQLLAAQDALFRQQVHIQREELREKELTAQVESSKAKLATLTAEAEAAKDDTNNLIQSLKNSTQEKIATLKERIEKYPKEIELLRQGVMKMKGQQLQYETIIQACVASPSIIAPVIEGRKHINDIPKQIEKYESTIERLKERLREVKYQFHNVTDAEQAEYKEKYPHSEGLQATLQNWMKVLEKSVEKDLPERIQGADQEFDEKRSYEYAAIRKAFDQCASEDRIKYLERKHSDDVNTIKQLEKDLNDLNVKYQFLSKSEITEVMNSYKELSTLFNRTVSAIGLVNAEHQRLSTLEKALNEEKKKINVLSQTLPQLNQNYNDLKNKQEQSAYNSTKELRVYPFLHFGENHRLQQFIAAQAGFSYAKQRFENAKQEEQYVASNIRSSQQRLDKATQKHNSAVNMARGDVRDLIKETEENLGDEKSKIAEIPKNLELIKRAIAAEGRYNERDLLILACAHVPRQVDDLRQEKNRMAELPQQIRNLQKQQKHFTEKLKKKKDALASSTAQDEKEYLVKNPESKGLKVELNETIQGLEKTINVDYQKKIKDVQEMLRNYEEGKTSAVESARRLCTSQERIDYLNKRQIFTLKNVKVLENDLKELRGNFTFQSVNEIVDVMYTNERLIRHYEDIMESKEQIERELKTQSDLAIKKENAEKELSSTSRSIQIQTKILSNMRRNQERSVFRMIQENSLLSTDS